MKSLHFSGLVVLILTLGCSTVKDLGVPWESPFTGSFEKALFKTSLDIMENHISGYTLIKKTADSAYHIVFSNEIGMTIYDFELFPESFKVNYLFGPMYKKVMIKIFERDFRQLIYGFIYSRQNFFNKTLIKVKKGKDAWPSEIMLYNPGIKMEMQLQHMTL